MPHELRRLVLELEGMFAQGRNMNNISEKSQEIVDECNKLTGRHGGSGSDIGKFTLWIKNRAEEVRESTRGRGVITSTQRRTTYKNGKDSANLMLRRLRQIYLTLKEEWKEY